jgi:hypothetical protein
MNHHEIIVLGRLFIVRNIFILKFVGNNLLKVRETWKRRVYKTKIALSRSMYVKFLHRSSRNNRPLL